MHPAPQPISLDKQKKQQEPIFPQYNGCDQSREPWTRISVSGSGDSDSWWSSRGTKQHRACVFQRVGRGGGHLSRDILASTAAPGAFSLSRDSPPSPPSALRRPGRAESGFSRVQVAVPLRWPGFPRARRRRRAARRAGARRRGHDARHLSLPRPPARGVGQALTRIPASSLGDGPEADPVSAACPRPAQTRQTPPPRTAFPPS